MIKEKRVAYNILNNTILLTSSGLNPEEENFNTPDRKSSNSANRLALPTSLGDMERQWQQV